MENTHKPLQPGIFLFLHLLLMVYSLSGVFSKWAAGQPFLSVSFCLCYGAILALLGLYAIGWQQIIKHLPLTMAYANKAVTTIWGLIWGVAFFQEQVTPGKLAGIALVIAGIVLYVRADGEA